MLDECPPAERSHCPCMLERKTCSVLIARNDISTKGQCGPIWQRVKPSISFDLVFYFFRPSARGRLNLGFREGN